MKKISVITINFNQPLLTEQLLASIFSATVYKAIELIVVDNGSTINPVPGWRAKYNNIKFIRSEENTGFAGGNNLGIQAATGDYFFFVNNDTVFTGGLIETLGAILDQHPQVGAVSPMIRYFDQPDIIQYAGFSAMNFNTGRNRCIGQSETDTGQYDHCTGPTGFAHGAAMMVRKEAIAKAGMMAENFFLYYEEMDWCERIKRCGYQVWIEPKALIYHRESMSAGKNSAMKEYFMVRNRLLFIRRNAPPVSIIIFYVYFLLIVTPYNLLKYLTVKRGDLARAFLIAIRWNFMHKKDSTELGYPVHKIGK